MNQELQQIIEQAATDFARTESTELAGMGLPLDQAKLACAGYYDGFRAGADFATTSPVVLQHVLKGFAQWLSLKGFTQDIDLKWRYKFLGEVRVYAETTEELISKYIIETKKKEDGNATTK